jgi:hypothetical protein
MLRQDLMVNATSDDKFKQEVATIDQCQFMVWLSKFTALMNN